MTLADAVFAILWGAFTLYLILGGADFGGGVWDLVAWGPLKIQQRRAIAKAMGPVWEANHVWLIFVIVGLFTNFPRAFSILSIALFIPFTLVLAGIVLRGASFVFRAHAEDVAQLSAVWGSVFGITSTITPFVLGTCAGAVASGRIRVHGDLVTADSWGVWTGPFSLLCGALSLTICAHVAAIFLCTEAMDAQNSALADTFRVRALLSGFIGGILAILGLLLARNDASQLWSELSHRALPLVLLSALLACMANIFVVRRQYKYARIFVVAQFALMLAAWAYAQSPYLVVPDVTVSSAASPEITLQLFGLSAVLGGALLVPSLWYLLRTFKRHVTDTPFEEFES